MHLVTINPVSSLIRIYYKDLFDHFHCLHEEKFVCHKIKPSLPYYLHTLPDYNRQIYLFSILQLRLQTYIYTYSERHIESIQPLKYFMYSLFHYILFRHSTLFPSQSILSWYEIINFFLSRRHDNFHLFLKYTSYLWNISVTASHHAHVQSQNSEFYLSITILLLRREMSPSWPFGSTRFPRFLEVSSRSRRASFLRLNRTAAAIRIVAACLPKKKEKERRRSIAVRLSEGNFSYSGSIRGRASALPASTRRPRALSK